MLKKTVRIGGIVVLSLSVWMGGMLGAASFRSESRGLGLPYRVTQALERMDQQVRTARCILHARPHCIRFIDKDDVRREYSYAYDALWQDGYPVVSGVKAFHFEYRDGNGSLFIRSDLHRSDVRRIAYSIRVTSRDEDVIRNRSLRVNPSFPPDGGAAKEVAWAGLAG